MDTCLADETRLNSIPDPSHIHIIKTIIFKVARVFIYMSPHDCLYYSYKKKKMIVYIGGLKLYIL